MQPLEFESFLSAYAPTYVIDRGNAEHVYNLGLWANRSPEFEKNGYYLDKGIALVGGVGVGKTEIMRMLRNYLAYLKSPYIFKTQIVWKFAELFSDSGYGCFKNQSEGNVYYDELCLTDERTGIPVKEYASYYGTKILVGTELVMARYNLFKHTGLQSHFTTNEAQDTLESVYGERVGSRLKEMCNFFTMVAMDRRDKIRPTFYQNTLRDPAYHPKPVTAEEVLENKKRLNADYQAYLQKGTISEFASIDFRLFELYGKPVASEEQLQRIRETIQVNRKEEVMTNSESVGSALRVVKLRKLYETNELDKEEKDFLWEQARKIAVKEFFERLKMEGKTEVFELHSN